MANTADGKITQWPAGTTMTYRIVRSSFTSTELTKYDPTSVRHYFCGGIGNPKLEISDLDKFSAQMIYGPPLDGTAFA